MPLPAIVLPGDVLVCCSPDWLQADRSVGDLQTLYSKVLRISADITVLHSTVEQVIDLLKVLPLSVDRRDVLAMVTSDLLLNAITYGPPDVSRQIDVGVQYIPGIMISVGITDTLGAIPFDQFTLDPTTTAKLAELSEHGRGIFIARSTVDLLSYNPDATSPLKEILVGVVPLPEEATHAL